MSDMNQPDHQDNHDQSQPVHELVDDLFNVGKAWASHGLNIGKASLQQSAKTLELTAAALETLAKRLTTESEETDDAKDD